MIWMMRRKKLQQQLKNRRRNMKRFLILALVLSACNAPYQVREAAVIDRAAFDLSCSKENIKVTKLQEDGQDIIYGAEGCENKSTYQTRTRPFTNEALVYKEGAAPNPVVVNQTISNPVQPYKSVITPGIRRY
jgi:hypothetical protein